MAPPDAQVGPVPEGRDPDEYDRLRRRVLWSLPTGLFVVGSRAGEHRNLMTANWVMQIATSPKLVAVAVERAAVTRRLIEAGGGFSVSVLAREDRALVRRFAKPVDTAVSDASGAVTSMQGLPVHSVAGGLPCLTAALAWLACAVRATCTWEGTTAARDGGTTAAPGGEASHVLFVGEVVDAGEQSGAHEGARPDVLRMEDTRMNYGG